MRHTRWLNRRAPAFVALLFGAFLLISPRPAAAQDPDDACASAYAEAEEHYFAAEFDAAIQLLRTCLDTADLDVPARVRIYRLLSFAHIAQGNDQQARLTIQSLLDVQPDYTPDPSRDRPDYVELVREIKAERPAPSSEGSRRWVRWTLGSAGAIAAGVLTAVLVGGNGNGDGDDDGLSDLPDQPPPPPQ